MEYDRSSTKEKWTIMKYMRDFDLMTTYAYALRASNELTKENIGHILATMIEDGIYHPRYGEKSIDTGNFKVIQIAWYMFGYYDNATRKRTSHKKFVFSPLGNLLLDNLKDKEKSSKIFLTMLFANGFKQPFSRMSPKFNIYAYRLIFQLLRDPRLDGKLYHDEVFYFVVFLKTITEKVYDELISDILQFRKIPATEKLKLFKKDESVIAQSLHEWNYATGLLETAGIVNVYDRDSGNPIGVLCHGNGTGRRVYKQDFIRVRKDIAAFMDIMLAKYPFYEEPFPLSERERSFDHELILKMYSFYPKELLVEIGIESKEQETISKLLRIAKQINEHSHNETDMGYLHFEFALRDAFNLFEDVKAVKIGGPGNTDVECLYIPDDFTLKKFDVEAKSRRLKLVEISAGRLKSHRNRIGSLYTVIVTPDYSPAVMTDIEQDKSVIIKSMALSNFLYQYITRVGRNISYFPLHQIVINNFGKDVTGLVNEYIYNNFGHGYSED